MERGISLVPLAVTGLSTGLYGRACVSVGDPKGRPLPAHRLGAGDQVRLYSTKGSGTKGSSSSSSKRGDAAEDGVSEISGETDRGRFAPSVPPLPPPPHVSCCFLPLVFFSRARYFSFVSGYMHTIYILRICVPGP